MKNEDFADAIRGELQEMRTPVADDKLLERIRQSRAAGARVILPLDDARRRRRPLMLTLSAVAAAAIVVLVVGTWRSETAPLPSSESWFGGEVAFAGQPQQLAYPVARVTLAARMRPMTVVYDMSLRDSTGAVVRRESQLSVARDSIDGARAWRLVARRTLPRGLAIDSVWVSAADFAPLRQTITHAPYSRYERLTVWQRFAGLHVTGEMNAWEKGALSARRTFDRRLAADAGPYVPDAFAPLFHIGIAMDRNWSGRAAILGWLVRDDNIAVPISLRVVGEEAVRVPAGAFSCWRLAIEGLGAPRWYWLRKSDGLGVRMLDSASERGGGAREVVLRSVQTR